MKNNESRKNYVIDTSAIIDDPYVFFKFPNSNIIVPIVVLEELDNLKVKPNETGKCARLAIKILEDITQLGVASQGIPLEDGIILSVESYYYPSSDLEPNTGDSRIIGTAYALKNLRRENVTVVSNDINMRLRARAKGIAAISHELDNIVPHNSDEMYTGYKEIVNSDAGAELIANGFIDPRLFNIDLEINQSVILKDNEDNKPICYGRKFSTDEVRLIRGSQAFGIKSRNKEQALALDVLLDPKISLVTLVGSAGSGKSILVLGAGLQQVIEKSVYERFLIYKPTIAVSQEIGFLPGPQPLTAKILTPNGWTTMGELSVGSRVISRDGKPTNVIGIYPKGVKKVFRITTSDGSSTECCEDHLWYTETFENKKRGNPGSIKTTKEIMKTIYRKGSEKPNHYLPRVEAVEYDKKELTIPPYILGCILGDGSIGDNIDIANVDLELIERVRKELKTLNCFMNNPKGICYNISSKLFNCKTARNVKVTNVDTGEYHVYPSIGRTLESININRGTLHNRCENQVIIDGFKYEFLPLDKRWQNPIKEELFKLGLSGKMAWDKSIPEVYKYSSVDDRIALLQGLMDTDGTVKVNGEASFCTTSKQLALDIIELVKSLGGRSVLHLRDRIGRVSYIGDRSITTRRISYEFNISLPENINPFYITRKAKRFSSSYMHGIAIKSIEFIGEKEVQCIRVDNPEHMYVTDDFLVTHNTQEEKLAPWFEAIIDNLEVILGSRKKLTAMLDLWKDKEKVSFEAMTYIRGRSITNSFILVDESQNLSKEDIKTILTRVGTGTKIVMLGDICQIDSPKLDKTNNGLSYIVEKFRNCELAAHITLKEGVRSPLATKAAQILLNVNG